MILLLQIHHRFEQLVLELLVAAKAAALEIPTLTIGRYIMLGYVRALDCPEYLAFESPSGHLRASLIIE